EEPIGLATMRLLVFLFRTHLRKRLRRTLRLKPGVPSEDRGAARLDEDLTMSLAKEEVRFGAIPVPHATLRFRGTIVQRVSHGGESLAPCRFEQPSDIGAGKITELVEAERNVFDDEAAVCLGFRDVEFVASDLFDGLRLNLRKR